MLRPIDDICMDVRQKLPSSIAGLPHINDVFAERKITRISADYHELFDLPHRMLRWGPDAILAFRYDDLRALGVNPVVGNFPAETFVRMGFTAMLGLPVPFEEAGNILRFQKNQFFTTEQSVHAAIKRIFAQPLMPKAMPQFQAMGERIASAIVDAVAGKGEIDLVGDFATALAMKFWGEVFGMTPDELSGLSDAMHKLVPLTAGLDHTEAGFRRLNDEGFPEYWRYLVPAIRRARESGQHMFLDRMATQFSALPADLGELPEDVDMFVACNMIDAFHALAGGVACTIHEMIADGDVYTSARQDETLGQQIVVEALRLNPQVPLITRHVHEDFEYEGMSIPRGSRVSLYWAAANRDPDAFVDPTKFLLNRGPNPPLTFGNGAQICPGRNIAQTMALAAIRVLTQPGVSVSLSGRIEWAGGEYAPATSPSRIPVIVTKK